jgi:hypothetical protein
MVNYYKGSMKSYRFLGDEMEILGNRLDSARERAANSKSTWARNYWQQNVDRLLFRWQQLPLLHDGDALTTVIPKWTIDYNFYETEKEGGLYGGISDRLYDHVFRKSVNLDASWEAHRAQRLAKAQ